MDAGAYGKARCGGCREDLACAGKCTRGSVEAAEEPVAGAVEDGASMTGDLLMHRCMMRFEDLAPAPVSELGRERSRADEVGEEQRRENRVRNHARSVATYEGQGGLGHGLGGRGAPSAGTL